MAKKFKDDFTDGAPKIGSSLSMTLAEYVGQFAPDLMTRLPCMKGANPVEYYARLFEKEKQSESKRPNKNNGVQWDYAKRIIYLARKFRSFSEENQALVINARIANIFWRGDEPERFNTIITETILYRDLSPDEKKAYQKKLMKVAANMGDRHAMF